MKINITILNRLLRFISLTIVYAIILTVASYISLQVRFDFNADKNYIILWGKALIWSVPIQLILLALYGQYRSLLTYFSYPDAKCIVYSQAIAATITICLWYTLEGKGVVPRGVILTDFILSVSMIICLRMSMRRYRESRTLNLKQHPVKKRTLIVGAGSAGASIARDIQSKPGLGMTVICFIDTDNKLKGQSIHGVPVMGGIPNIQEIIRRLDIKRVVIAIPQASPLLIKEVVEILNIAGVEHDILPSIVQLLHREVTVNHLRHVKPEDLLGRKPVELNDMAINTLINDKIIIVTGAGGSIGSELCRQIASHSPRKLILIERNEPALFKIEQEVIKDFKWIPVEPYALDVSNEKSVESIFEKEHPEIIFHAAAHKHVPLMERQPGEAILNNCIGTLVIARNASTFMSKQMILVSTDKAVNPTNVMGATKRVAELLVSAIQKEEKNTTVFSSVRFGNVLGSSGSVIPTFDMQISRGGPVTVTHPEVTRYFMSIPEAVGLILQSATQAKGGEIFVLDMGEPIKIVDLAKQMIELTGFVPDEDIKIEFTGLRPGEKLYEEPIHKAENVQSTSHLKVKCLTGNGNHTCVLQEIKSIKEKLHSASNPDLKSWLSKIVPEYNIWNS